MNRPITGDGAAETLLCGLAGISGLLASTRSLCPPAVETWLVGTGTWDSRCLGVGSRVASFNERRAYGDIYPSVWHSSTREMEPASSLPTQFCLRVEGNVRFLRSGMQKSRVCGELPCSRSLGKLHVQQEMLMRGIQNIPKDVIEMKPVFLYAWQQWRSAD